MKNLKITVNGVVYDVQVEEADGSAAPAAAAAPKTAAPAPKAGEDTPPPVRYWDCNTEASPGNAPSAVQAPRWSTGRSSCAAKASAAGLPALRSRPPFPAGSSFFPCASLLRFLHRHFTLLFH